MFGADKTEASNRPSLPVNKINRRQFAGGTTAGVISLAVMSRADAAPTAKVHDLHVISKTPEYYCGWPTLTQRGDGELIVVWSGGREAHVCPFGRVDMMRSKDNAQTWTWPRTIIDGSIDDRDAGVLETAKGSILVTTFTSLAYESYELEKAQRSGSWPAEKLARWMSVHTRLTAEQRKAELGQWMVRSIDGGVTWSTRYPTIVNSPHGPVQLADGRLLYAGKKLWSESKQVGVCESKDDGQSWQWLSEIPTRDGDDAKNYHELHAVEANDGMLVVQIRNHNDRNKSETLQCESIDGGKNWTVPHEIGVWGLPSFLTKLRDGRLLMSYGHRRKPYGNQARVSRDNGKNWSEPIIISDDGAGGDLGYPSTIETNDGMLVTVWYEKMQGSSKAVLRQARWSLQG